MQIRAARQARGWSQDRLAETLGTSRKRIIDWEYDRNRPNRRYRRLLSALLEIPAEEFEPEEDPEIQSLLDQLQEIRSRRALGSAA